MLNVKVIFVTDPSLDFKALLENAKKADAITNTLTHIMEGLPTDCTVCQLKDICDEVEGMKELRCRRQRHKRKGSPLIKLIISIKKDRESGLFFIFLRR